MVVAPKEFYDVVLKLREISACGMDNKTAEHLKLTTNKLYPLLTVCFAGFLVHGFLTDTTLSIFISACHFR